jgi:SAM-dependent methyltransferase
MSHSTHDSRERFTSRVEAYVAARPRYPTAITDHLREQFGLTSDWHVVDLGSGTGISCELFLASGNRVTGVEPNAAMRLAAERRLGAMPAFTSVNASAESTTLPDRSADLVIAAQAFHWFDIEAARREVLRILRPSPGGWALLMWNDRKRQGSEFLEAYERLLVEFGTDYLKIRHNNIDDQAFEAFFGAPGWQRATFANNQHLDFDGLRARLVSSSYVPQEDDERFSPTLQRLQDIFERHQRQERVTIEYQTELFYARPWACL